MRMARWVFGMCVLFSAAASFAGDIAVGGRIGTLGIGPEVSLATGERLVVRLGLFTFDDSRTYKVSGIEYDGDIELFHGQAVLSWHPTGGSFHLSGGVVLNDDRVTGHAPLVALLDEGDLEGFDAEVIALLESVGSLKGVAKFDSLGPYVGIGWGNPFGRRTSSWSAGFDLGAIYVGSPDVTLTAETSLPLSLIPGLQDEIDALVAAEELEAEADVEEARFFPVVTFSISYRF